MCVCVRVGGGGYSLAHGSSVEAVIHVGDVIPPTQWIVHLRAGLRALMRLNPGKIN